MKYFVNINSAEELRKMYRELVITMHPDKGGNAEEFAEMQNEYDNIKKQYEGSTSKAGRGNGYTAEDFANDWQTVSGAPLRGTRGKTFADLVAQLVYVFTHEEEEKEYQGEGVCSVCYGWDGSALSPVTRGAYVEKFGREVVELAEMASRVKVNEQKAAEDATQYAAHVRDARRHQADGSQAPQAGAFVYGVGCGWKSDGGRGVFVNFEAFAADPEEYTEYFAKNLRVCKVCEVYEVSAEDFARPELADELATKARNEGRDFEGGCRTDDPEPEEDPRDHYAKYRYYYSLCAAVVCRESGRWYLIDPEGYNYARYCYMPTTWRTMYADEVAEAQRQRAEIDEQERQEEERKAAEKLAEYREKCAKYEGAGLEDLTEYREAVSTANHEENEAGRAHGWRSAERKAAQKKCTAARAALTAAEKRNIKKMAESVYPGIKCKVTKADGWRSAGYVLTYEDGPTLETFNKNTDFDLFATYWEEYRMDDCTEFHRYDLTDFADKYGDGRGVEVVREMSKAERERLIAAILEAVPAAAGICWENRHQWTQNEVKQAAAACGVDGWDLWRTYDRKHTYFNYIDAETLAEWAHEMTAYDIKGKSRKTTTTDEPQAAAPATTTNETQAAAPAEGLQLVEIEGGVAIEGDSRTTYRNRREIKAHGLKWNKEAQRWQTTDPATVEAVRAWFGAESVTTSEPATDEAQAEPPANEPQAEAANLVQFVAAFADFLQTLGEIINEAAQWEGVTIPADTLQRWKNEATEGKRATAERLCDVCGQLADMTPDSRREFGALGQIFWVIAEQMRNGYTADTLQAAIDYSRRQLFELIDRTQNDNQARAIREAIEPSEGKRAAA